MYVHEFIELVCDCGRAVGVAARRGDVDDSLGVGPSYICIEEKTRKVRVR